MTISSPAPPGDDTAAPGGELAGVAELTAELTSWDEARLERLLDRRPDLAAPAPASLGALAGRAATRASVDNVLRELDRPELAVAEAAVALGRLGKVTHERLLAAVDLDPAMLRRAIDDLGEQLLLVAGRPAQALAEALGPYPARLGPAAAELGDEVVVPQEARELDALLAGAPEGARRVLEALAHEGPVGTVREGVLPPSTAWLLRQGLLHRLGGAQVVIPLETALLLRGGRTHPGLDPAVAWPSGDPRDLEAVLADGAARAEETVRLATAILHTLATHPVGAVRTGGIGQRELRRVAEAVELDLGQAAMLIEVMACAGLLEEMNDAAETSVFVPAPSAETWASWPLGQRWAHLALAWLGSTRAMWLIGTRDDRGRVRGALEPGLERGWVAPLRRRVLAVLADISRADAPDADVAAANGDEMDGTSPNSAGQDGAGQDGTRQDSARQDSARQDSARQDSAATTRALDTAGVHAVLSWHRPRATPPESSVAAVLAEAAFLGLTGAGAITPAGADLLGSQRRDGEPALETVAETVAAVAAALEAALPAPVAQVLLQADLTGVVPGRPAPELADLLELSASVESRGGALGVRFTADSIRGALDAGYTAERLRRELTQAALAGLPQALEYLIADVARLRDRIRVGGVGSYVRTVDAATAAELLTDQRLTVLGLHELAPTVLVSAAPPAELHAVLDNAGYAPLADSVGAIGAGGTSPGGIGAEGAGIGHHPLAFGRPRGRRRDVTARRQAAVITSPGQQPRRALPRWPESAESVHIRRGLDDAARADLARRLLAAGRPGALTSADDSATLVAVLRDAAAAGTEVEVAIVDATGARQRRRVRPTSAEGGRVRMVDVARETEIVVAVHRIALVWTDG